MKKYNILHVVWFVLNIIPFPMGGVLAMPLVALIFGLRNDHTILIYHLVISSIIFVLSVVIYFYEKRSNKFIAGVISSLLVLLISLSVLSKGF